MSWNVRSLNNKVNEIMDFVETHGISLFFVQETWLTEMNNHTTAIIKAHGFDIHHCYRQQSVGGGVALIFKPALKIVKLFIKHSETFESVCVKVILPSKSSLLCACIYRTGNCGSFFHDFDGFIGDIFTRFEKILICGDVNFHMEQTTVHTTELMRVITSYGLHQQIKCSTHSAGHTLDAIFSSHKVVDLKSLHVLSNITEQGFSSCDHFPILFTLRDDVLKADDKKVIQFRNIKSINQENDLRETP